MTRTARRAALLLTAVLAAAGIVSGGAPASAAVSGPQGSLDAVSLHGVSGVEVRGWVADGTDTTSVAVYVDGAGHTLSSSASRPDVQAHLSSSQSQYGFDHVVPLPAGTHQVCAYALSQHGAPNPLLACQSITAPYNPIGVLDTAVAVCRNNPLYDTVRVTGWEFDPDRLGGSGVVDTYVHSPVFGTTTGVRNPTTIHRPDVAAAYGLSNDLVGFSFEVSQKYGFDTARLYGVNTDGAGTNPHFATVYTSALSSPNGC
jgi:hypothetical protein